MSTIVTRAGKGSALTHNEVDANFNNLNNDKIEAAQSVTLTNKTIALGSNTVSGTTAQFNTALTDGDFATLAGSETLTNKTISGSSNTLSNISNASLTNSSVTIGSTSVSLGSTATTVSGLTLSSPTVNTPTLSGGTINNASVGATTPSSGAFTTLSATGVTTVQAGTAAAPSITFSGDTNTGIYSPGADTWAVATGGTEALRIDSARNMGLGVTPSASWATSNFKALQIKNGSAAAQGGADLWLFANAVYDGTNFKYLNASSSRASVYRLDDGQHLWYNTVAGTAGNNVTLTQAMTLDAAGWLGLGSGATSPAAPLHISNSQNEIMRLQTSDATTGAIFFTFYDSASARKGYIGYGSGGNDNLEFYNDENAPIVFSTNATERARITSGGFSKFSVAGTYADPARFHEMRTNQSDYATVFSCTASSSPYGINVNYTAAAPNNTTSTFLECVDSVAARASIRSNGGIANYSANNVNLSDRREKTNFAPAKNYLDVICAIPVQTFNYIDQAEDDPGLTLGVVAQDVQAVAPEMVMESNWGSEEEPKMRLSIYQTDLQYALMKSIQELKAIVDAQAAEIAALKGNA